MIYKRTKFDNLPQDVRGALCGLSGCPVGGWPETEQAFRRIYETLPYQTPRDQRDMFVSKHLMVVDGRYAFREMS